MTKLLFFSFLALGFSGFIYRNDADVLGSRTKKASIYDKPSHNLSSQDSVGHIREIAVLVKKSQPTPTPRPESWGTARQIDEYTWTMQVEHDSQMATPSEIISALNSYRVSKGRGQVSFDANLSSYAQERANYFLQRGSMDSHAGFKDFITNQDGFTKLGFNSLGENASYGYVLNGTHLIEWVYAGDAPHDTNQLNQEWTHIGVGVAGEATAVIFGGKKK